MEAVRPELVKYDARERTAYLRHTNRKAAEEDLATASDVDPFEVAYWRGGEHEVLRLWLFKLVERGYLEVRETRTWLGTKGWLTIAHGGPPRENLSDLERELVNWFVAPLRGSDIFTRSMPECLASACTAYRTRLRETGLISRCSDASRHLMWARAYRIILAPAAALAAGAALYSVSMPLPLLVVFSFAAFAAIKRALDCLGQPRLTMQGRKRLEELQAHFSALKKKRFWVADRDADHPAHLMAVGVFGTSVLAISSYDAFAAVLASGKGGNWSPGGECGCRSRTSRWSIDGESGCGGDGDGGCGGCGD
jgi:uncharacterized protein (TIGR04222 family)